eukprot:gene10426-2557_t
MSVAPILLPSIAYCIAWITTTFSSDLVSFRFQPHVEVLLSRKTVRLLLLLELVLCNLFHSQLDSTQEIKQRNQPASQQITIANSLLCLIVSLSEHQFAHPCGGKSNMPANEQEIVVKPVSDQKNLKPCCACPETKKPRDKCIMDFGEENCYHLIAAHKVCIPSQHLCR